MSGTYKTRREYSEEARPMLSAMIASRPALVEYLTVQLQCRDATDLLRVAVMSMLITLDQSTPETFHDGMELIVEDYAMDLVAEYRNRNTVPLEWLGHGDPHLTL